MKTSFDPQLPPFPFNDNFLFMTHAIAVAARQTTSVEPVSAVPESIEQHVLPAHPWEGLVRKDATSEDAFGTEAANDEVAGDDVAEMELLQRVADEQPTLSSSNRNIRLRAVVGPRLTHARAASGFTQTEAATALGYATPAQLCQWETGRRLPPLSELIKAARLYSTSLDYLMGEVPEMDRDPAAGLRQATLRGVRLQLERCALVAVDEIVRHARLVGTDSGSSRLFTNAGQDLLQAAQGFMRQNEAGFQEMRGGARLACMVERFEASLLEAQKRQRVAQQLDADLRQRLANLPGDDEALTEPD